MDPITILQMALVQGVAVGLSSTAPQAIKDTYSALKELIYKKVGNKGGVVEALKQIEQVPDSKELRITLKEELTAASVYQDGAVMELANRLLQIIEEAPQDQIYAPGGTFTKIDGPVTGGKISITNIERIDKIDGGLHIGDM